VRSEMRNREPRAVGKTLSFRSKRTQAVDCNSSLISLSSHGMVGIVAKSLKKRRAGNWVVIWCYS